MGDCPSATPLDHVESMADLDEQASMEALHLTKSKSKVFEIDADGDLAPEDTAETDDDDFGTPKPLNQTALMQTMDGSDYAIHVRNNKRSRVISGSHDSESGATQIAIQKGKNPRSGSFLHAIKFGSEGPASCKVGSHHTPQDLVRFQSQAADQRARIIEIQEGSSKAQIECEKEMSSVMR